MKLSIITINFNNAPGLEKTIGSVIKQSYTNYEYIVIDGGSTDGSKKVIEKYADKIAYWVSEPDSGIYNAMNKGIKIAKGEYLLFINSGDSLYTNDVIEKVLSSNLSADIVYGDLHRTFPSGGSDIVIMPNKVNINYILDNVITHPTSFIKRELLLKHNGYREDLKIVSDWAFTLDIIAFTNSTTRHIPIIVSSFAMDGISSNNSKLAQNEREKVILESFSYEILEMIQHFDTLNKFYSKKIFAYPRRLGQILKSAFSPSYWSQVIHRRRKNTWIRQINKHVREQKKNLLSIPVIIINYNRLSDLKNLVTFLTERNHKNIVIVDNKSSYLPLLAYYETIKDKVTIEQMEDNAGHLVFWKNEKLQEQYAKGYYIVTDSDIIPNENLPKDYLKQMIALLDENREITKVGFALKIDDIPDTFVLKDKVLNWEKQFWTQKIKENTYLADIDTTFALYPPKYKHDKYNFLKGIRLAGNFEARHGGWYIDQQNMTDEEKYYFKTADYSNSWKLETENESLK